MPSRSTTECIAQTSSLCVGIAVRGFCHLCELQCKDSDRFSKTHKPTYKLPDGILNRGRNHGSKRLLKLIVSVLLEKALFSLIGK